MPIVGSINALTISITHPANIAYSINPNNEDGFYCTDIVIQNNSKVPVNISIQTFKAVSGGDLIFEDVLPDSKDWNSLSRQETKSYIALGLRYADESEWMIPQPMMSESLYAIEIDDTYIGALSKYSNGALRLVGKHGLAFDRSYSAKHNLVFIISLL